MGVETVVPSRTTTGRNAECYATEPGSRFEGKTAPRRPSFLSASRDPNTMADDAPNNTTKTEEQEDQEPQFDAATCKAIAIGLPAFWDGMLDGEWDGTEYEYYLEPAGVKTPLKCARAPENDPQRAGLLMTRSGWKAKKVALDDGINPETYELSFPKEFGYVKPLAHYRPHTYEHAKYPWSKRY